MGHAQRWPGGTPPDDVVLGQRWGDYLVVARLGAGGMGAVYLALQWPLGLPAALKVLTATSQTLAERFHSEAAALARLSHPNIVRVFGCGVQHGRPYLAMEYVEGGGTLADAIARGLPPEAVPGILRQLANALESAHDRGIVHRDLKPQNVMLQEVAGEPHHVKLVDFGLAKFIDEGHSTRLLAGTPAYMAPEQLTGRDIGPWTDVYALAVIAFELWTGRRPFGGRTTEEVIRRKIEPGNDPTADLPPDAFPPALRAALRQALAVDPYDRPRSARALRDVFEPFASVTSSPPDPGVVAPLERHTSAEMLGESAVPPPVASPSRGIFPWLGVVVAAAVVVAVIAWAIAPRAPAPAPAAAVTAEPTHLVVAVAPPDAAPVRPTSAESAPPPMASSPVPTVVAAALAPRMREPARPRPPTPAPATAAADPAADTVRDIEAALGQCRCVRARRLLDQLAGGPEADRLGARVSTCREPLVGERCVDGVIQ